jgi:hypothetical protein
VFSLALIRAVVPAVVHATEKAQTKRPTAQKPEVVLSTIPRHVYKVVDRVDAKEKNECWYFHVVVDDTRTPARDPMSASVTLYSGPTVRKKLEFGAEALSSQRAVTFKKNAGIVESFDLRHHFCEPVALSIDRVRYELELGVPSGKKIRASVEIPILTYIQKTRLVFPIKGNFVVTNGNVAEGGHHEWSQQFAYDILGLDPHLAMITGEGTKNEEFVGWGREVIAPADGVVTYSRNDVPDNSGPGVIDMDALQALPEQPWPVAGNVVVIDHGGGEYSLLGHMQKGSVRVKRGDHVRRADVLGLLGNSGHSQGPHLHYHLMNGEFLFRSDGLPSRFENVEGGTPTQGVMSEAK